MNMDAKPPHQKSRFSRCHAFLFSTGLTFLIINCALLNLDLKTNTENYLHDLLDGCGKPLNYSNTGSGNSNTHNITAMIINQTTESSPTDNDGNGKKLFCSPQHRGAVDFCSHNDNNKVMMRSNNEFPASWGTMRPYSISPMLPPEALALPKCISLDHYLSAIKLGTRMWPNNNNKNNDNGNDNNGTTAAATDQKASVFLPYGCHVPSIPPPPSQTCATLNRYNHVLFHGDSLTRHVRMAIHMSMRGNFVTGGLMTNDPRVADDCKCDGQFSEARLCRTSDAYFDETMQPRRAPRGEGDRGVPPACPVSEFVLGKRYMAPWLTRRGKVDVGANIDWSSIDCRDANYKGVLLFLQGGLHWYMNASDTFEAMVKPVIAHPKFEECLCFGKVRMIWEARNAQSRVADEYYPHQSRENGLLFNEEIRKSFESTGLVLGKDVLILDWWNMTADAQSSDGVHYLSDVNLAKAAHLLYLVEHWPFPKSYRAEAGSC